MRAPVHQQGRTKGYLPWLLSYVLLAQGLFPIQAHTQWVVDPDGMVVTVCSLLGERTEVLEVDHDGSGALDGYHCPACLFSTLLGATVASTPTPTPDTLFRVTALSVDPVQGLPYIRKPLTRAIRAPPVA